jgi:predicted nuclease of predicted toxin-antitoxin system
MNVLLDAHLPRRLVVLFRAAGHDAIHTLDLPDGNATSDAEILAVAEREQRVVMTKDADFVDSSLLHGRPAKLLLITTGNIDNATLEHLLVQALPAIAAGFAQHTYLELSRTALIIHQ